MGKGINLIKSLEVKKISFKSPPRIKLAWMRKDRVKYQVIYTTLKAKSSSEWFLDNGNSRHMTRENTPLFLLKITMVGLLLLEIET